MLSFARRRRKLAPAIIAMTPCIVTLQQRANTSICSAASASPGTVAAAINSRRLLPPRIPRSLFVAPHGSCLLFDSQEALFHYERLGPPSTDISDHNRNEAGGSHDMYACGDDSRCPSSDATADFFLNQPATDEGACGLDDAWSERERADLRQFIRRAASKNKPEAKRTATAGSSNARPDPTTSSGAFSPLTITKVVDIGCGTGRFSAMWPLTFPNAAELRLVEPCGHFLEAAVQRLKNEFAWSEEDEEVAVSPHHRSPLGFGVPRPSYFFTIHREKPSPLLGNVHPPDHLGGTAATSHSIRVVCYQLTVDEYMRVAEAEASSTAAQSDVTGAESENGSCNFSKTASASKKSEGKQTKEVERGEEEGIIVTTGVVQYLTDEQIFSLASLEQWALMKEDVSVAVVAESELLLSSRSEEGIEGKDEQRSEGGAVRSEKGAAGAGDGMAHPAVEENGSGVATNGGEGDDEGGMAALGGGDWELSIGAEGPALQNGVGGEGRKVEESTRTFRNAAVRYTVPMIKDLVSKRLAAGRGKKERVGGGGGASEQLRGSDEVGTEEAAAPTREEENNEKEIPVALCYASDGGTVRTLGHFEALFGATVGSGVCQGNTKSTTTEEEEVEGNDENRRPFDVYYSGLQWDMPLNFYSPLSTWLLRRKK